LISDVGTDVIIPDLYIGNVGPDHEAGWGIYGNVSFKRETSSNLRPIPSKRSHNKRLATSIPPTINVIISHGRPGIVTARIGPSVQHDRSKRARSKFTRMGDPIERNRAVRALSEDKIDISVVSKLISGDQGV
jgi:hypothetical protein